MRSLRTRKPTLGFCLSNASRLSTIANHGNRYSGKFYSSYEWEKEKEAPILYDPQNPVESYVCDEDESPIVPAVHCILELLGGL